MNETEYRAARRRFLDTGEIEPALLDLLRDAVRKLIKFGGLPPLYSPTGAWDDDGENEALGSWVEGRLIKDGQLASILQRASTTKAFLAIGEEAVRRHLINNLPRTQSRNLFKRLQTLFAEDPDFENAGGKYWRNAGSNAEPWQGSDRDLRSHAWALGEFEEVVYKSDAKKLSPLLPSGELKRFASELMTECDSALSIDDILDAIRAVFNVPEIEFEEFEETSVPGTEDEQVGLIEPAQVVAVLAELSAPQVDLLKFDLESGELKPVRETSEVLGRSSGSISADRSAIAKVLSRTCGSEYAMQREMLNKLRDALLIT